jgi:hypothetical protein
VEWIDLVPVGGGGGGAVKMAMNIWVNSGNILSGWTAMGFSKLTQLLGVSLVADFFTLYRLL